MTMLTDGVKHHDKEQGNPGAGYSRDNRFGQITYKFFILK